MNNKILFEYMNNKILFEHRSFNLAKQRYLVSRELDKDLKKAQIVCYPMTHTSRLITC